ncbi:hypothetical protein NLJ89_g9899 [Agrocybe chaxingu]|uniref:Glutamyl-tRNA(Gln) amidotransferase subunit B, mitochondrial n=1 Tax=Agrocybe chaxingu TaxID=84603 RepID=A0A9W8JZ60_9AGAR|nr:hypothetical protein NLJ89_g9899 [Agrocybe chaxingu]
MLVRRLRPTLHFRAFHDLRTYQEDVRWPGWQVIIGIETHAQLKSRRKLFSGAQLIQSIRVLADLAVESLISSPDDHPNTHVSPFDAAFPGTLPKVNPKCVDLALRTALALKCRIAHRSSFDRKHYFYSDLPSAPLAKNGKLQVQTPGSSPVAVRIKQIQLEQDTAKSTFNPRTSTSNIDLNRAGTGLMEIVSEPDLRSPEEAGAYVRTLQSVLRAMGSSDGNMEQGSLRCDVNVSVNPKGGSPGTRCEVKNLNSVRFMMAAIKHEIKRQIEYLLANPGSSVPQETRGFDEDTFETFRLRSKEDAPDYRYMPDPNLGVLVLSQSRIEEIQKSLPSLPWETRSRLLGEYPGLRAKEQSLDVLLNVDNGRDVGFDGEDSGGAIWYFERLCQEAKADGRTLKRDPVVVLNWLTHELLGQLAARKQTFCENPLSVSQLGELIDLVQSKTITGTSGKLLLRHMLSNPSSDPTKVATELELLALSATASTSSARSSRLPQGSAPPELQLLCEAAIAALPSEVGALRTGNRNVLNKIVGYVMKQSRGRADAVAARNLVEELVCQAHKE